MGLRTVNLDKSWNGSMDNNGHLQTNFIALFHNQLKQRTLQFIIFLSDVLCLSYHSKQKKRSMEGLLAGACTEMIM